MCIVSLSRVYKIQKLRRVVKETFSHMYANWLHITRSRLGVTQVLTELKTPVNDPDNQKRIFLY